MPGKGGAPGYDHSISVRDMIGMPDFLRQSSHAEQYMTVAVQEFVKKQHAQGNIVDIVGDELTVRPSAARLAYDKIYTGFNPSGFAMFRTGFEASDARLRRTLKERIKNCEGALDTYAHNGGHQLTPTHGELEVCKKLLEMLQ